MSYSVRYSSCACNIRAPPFILLHCSSTSFLRSDYCEQKTGRNNDDGRFRIAPVYLAVQLSSGHVVLLTIGKYFNQTIETCFFEVDFTNIESSSKCRAPIFSVKKAKMLRKHFKWHLFN